MAIDLQHLSRTLKITKYSLDVTMTSPKFAKFPEAQKTKERQGYFLLTSICHSALKASGKERPSYKKGRRP